MKFSLFPKDYVVFDFETTGLDPKKDVVIEIGAIKIINGEYTGEHINMLLDPKRPIPPEVSAINHITDDMVKGQPTVEQGMLYLFDFIGDLPVSGWNIKGFDIKFMRRYKEELLNEKFHNRAYDGILTAREWFNNDPDYIDQYPNKYNSNQADCSQKAVQDYFGITNPCQHRAIGDVMACFEINKKLDEIYNQKMQDTTKPIRDICKEAMLGPTMTKVMWYGGTIFVSQNADDMMVILKSNTSCYCICEGKIRKAVTMDGNTVMIAISYSNYELEMLANLYGNIEQGIIADICAIENVPIANVCYSPVWAVNQCDTMVRATNGAIMSVDQIMRACVGDNHYIASYIVPNNVLNISKVKKEHKETLAGYLPSVKLKIRADGKRIAGYDNNGNVILIVKSYKGGEYAILKRHSTETEVAMMKDMTAGL